MKINWLPYADFTRSLRFRLTIWNTFVVLITVVIALVSVREFMRKYMLIETDNVLDEQVKEIILEFEGLYPTDPNYTAFKAFLERIEKAHETHGWHIRWLDEDHNTFWKSASAPEDPTVLLDESSTEYKVWGSRTHRAIERQVKAPGLPKFSFRVGTEMKFIDEDVDRLTQVLAPVGFAIFLLSPLGGVLLAERAIEPLQRLIRTTERLRASHLDERLELRGVGDELDQLAGKINAFLDQIAEHLQKNRDFVANAAHDLRSPLAAIQSSVEVTLEKHRSVDEYEELLYQINDEVHHLGQLVNQLLQLAESEANADEISRESVPLADIVSHTIEMFEPVAEERGVRLKFDPTQDLVVSGVSRQLRQVLTNLVDNAIKFTGDGGLVTVGVMLATKPGYALVTVTDTGIGIPPESVGRVFDRFYQVDRSRQRFGEKRGNGLGLSICQSIINSHHGTISVTSEMGKGTTFSIVLPLADAV